MTVPRRTQRAPHGTVAWDYFVTCRCGGVRDAQDNDPDSTHALDCPYWGCHRYGCVPGELHEPGCPNASRNPVTP